MNAKKNLCAMIPADLHAKVIAEKEQLALSTLGEYVELVLKEHFEGGKTIMAATKTLAFQISEELDQRLKNFIAAEKKRGRKISQKEFVKMCIRDRPTVTPTETEPAAGSTNSSGQVYVPGFGYVENSGENTGIQDNEMYENGNKIGEMGSGN